MYFPLITVKLTIISFNITKFKIETVKNIPFTHLQLQLPSRNHCHFPPSAQLALLAPLSAIRE